MSRKFKVGAVVAVLSLVGASVALAAIQRGKFTGLSDDDEPVTIKVGENNRGKPVVTSFKVDQGSSCGEYKITTRNSPDTMPAPIEDRKFKVVDKIFGQTVFKVKAGFVTQAGNVIQGYYEQVVCDGITDDFFATHESVR